MQHFSHDTYSVGTGSRAAVVRERARVAWLAACDGVGPQSSGCDMMIAPVVIHLPSFLPSPLLEPCLHYAAGADDVMSRRGNQ